jgi:hypothetical protein
VLLTFHLLSQIYPANYFLLDNEDIVHVFIHKQATSTDVLKSFIHGLVLASLTKRGKSDHAEARKWMDGNYNIFITKVYI